MKSLNTSRFILNAVTEKHLPKIYEGLSNEKVTQYYAVHFNSLEATKEQMQWYYNLSENNTGIWWAITNNTDHTFLGAIGLNELDNTKKEIEIGFWLLPQFWKQGIISECLPFAIDYAFANFEIEAVIAYAETENKDSAKVLEKNHFLKSKEIIEEINHKGRPITSYKFRCSKKQKKTKPLNS